MVIGGYGKSSILKLINKSITVIIDKKITWYGSVNYLGYNTEDDNVIRVKDEVVAEEIVNICCTAKRERDNR